MRQLFPLELGAVAETVTVAGEAPLVDSASSQQVNTLDSQEVRELPTSRRNITNLLSLAPGVTTSGSGSVQMNGVAAGGTGVTVDGTEANSNPEARSLSQYGGQNQIDVMSIEAVSEVQIVKGVLPAEYGGVAGGQVNMCWWKNWSALASVNERSLRPTNLSIDASSRARSLVNSCDASPRPLV